MVDEEMCKIFMGFAQHRSIHTSAEREVDKNAEDIILSWVWWWPKGSGAAESGMEQW